jgi:membrane dipeptidase
MKTRLLLTLALVGLLVPHVQARDLDQQVLKILAEVPLIDGHNDVPWQFRSRVKNKIEDLKFHQGTGGLDKPMHTDIPRLKQGGVGAQFWSVWIPVSLSRYEAVAVTLEQIDLVHQLNARFPETFELALTAKDVVRIHGSGKIASLIGMEGGHSIGNSLGVLRMMYDIGARYMTLTHWKNTDWADAATDAPKHGGLTKFGKEVVREMNRMGMLVDLSHVSAKTMTDALKISKAPVIFSHSGAFAINPHPRNVPDAVLKKVKRNRGIVMVDFLESYVSKSVWEHGAQARGEKARLETMHLGDPTGVENGMKAWHASHPAPKATLAEVVDHMDHIKKLIGVDYIGIGSDFDGMGPGPTGLEDVSTYPALLKELLKRGYSEQDVKQIAGLNLLRVMRDAEKVAKKLQKKRHGSSMRLEVKE